MRVVVLGGTGLLGFHAVSDLRERGHEVLAVARSAGTTDARVLDLLACSDAELRAVVRGADAVVQAFGPDDRHRQRRPAARAFQAGLVDITGRLIRAVRQERVGTLVICGSYFTHLARAQGWPRRMTGQPYVRARLDQTALALDPPVGLSIALLELPFVFGAVPGRRPLWAPVVRYAASPWPLLAVPGGTTMIAAKDVAAAITNAAEGGVAPGRHPVGERFLSWKDWLETLARIAGRPRRARVLPGATALPFTNALERATRARGFEHGVDRTGMMRRVLEGFEIDASTQHASNAALGIAPRDLDAAFEATVRSTVGPDVRCRDG